MFNKSVLISNSKRKKKIKKHTLLNMIDVEEFLWVFSLIYLFLYFLGSLRKSICMALSLDSPSSSPSTSSSSPSPSPCSWVGRFFVGRGGSMVSNNRIFRHEEYPRKRLHSMSYREENNINITQEDMQQDLHVEYGKENCYILRTDMMCKEKNRMQENQSRKVHEKGFHDKYSRENCGALLTEEGSDSFDMHTQEKSSGILMAHGPVSLGIIDKGSAGMLRKRPGRLVVPPYSPGLEFGDVGRREENKEFEVEGRDFCLASKKGRRDTMEDGYGVMLDILGDQKQAFFAVIDGHGGCAAADYVAKNLGKNIVKALENSGGKAEDEFEEAIRGGYSVTDKEFLSQGVSSGACASSVLLKDGELHVANVGDCRVVLSRKGVAHTLTNDHRLSREDERFRIESSGGFVQCRNGVWRVHGSLAISRAIGDLHLKKWIISEPDIKKLPLTSDCQFLIMASDGLWDKKYNRHNRFAKGLNITKELLSPISITRQLRDQISLAKAFVVIAKESNHLQFAWELSVQIRNIQALLSNSALRQTPLTVEESETSIRNMAFLIYEAHKLHYDIGTMIMRMKAKIQTIEEQASSLNEKSSKYGQIAAEEVPKSLYCLGVKLTIEWYKNSNSQKKISDEEQIMKKRLKDNNFYHFCVFSDNILATSVVVNSTASNSNNPDLLVFHLVTDELNYAPMKAWFSTNSFRGVTIEVQKIEDFSWFNASYVPVLKQLQDSNTQSYYFSGNSENGQSTPIKYRNPKYLSILNHLRFYIPEVFPTLVKIVFLDDDVVVQKDLSPLFSIDLKGNVNGAVETCMETFHRYHKYLNYSHPLIREHFDPDACGWAFGMNVFDLVEWRKRNVTDIYHYWQEKNIDRTLWKLGTLPPGLLTFYELTEPLDPSWHVLGLGYTNVDPMLIKKGAVLHFNGNSKPWLKIGMEKYKPLWDKYVDYSHPMFQQCNVH